MYKPPLTIAFDIDGTWSRDPVLFRQMADAFQGAGWQVIIVTAATQPADKIERLGLSPFPIVVSRGRLKENAARRRGYMVNVWVDDMPGMIQECRILRDNDDL